MKAANSVREFELPSSKGIVDIMIIEHFFDGINEINERLLSMSIDPPDDIFPREKAINSGLNLFHVQKAVQNALKDPSRFSSFSRTMQGKLRQTFDILKDIKLEVLDHTGELYFPTMKIKVLAFEEDKQYEKPIIIETIEPTVYFKGELVKIGKVVVGKPKNT